MVQRLKSSDSPFPDYRLDLYSRPTAFSRAVVGRLNPEFPSPHRDTRQSQELALHVLLTNFKDWMEQAAGQDHDVAGLRIAKRPEHYTKPKNLGRGAWVTWIAISWAIKWLEHEGLIILARRGFRFEDGDSKSSLYKPTPLLRSLHQEIMTDPAVFQGLAQVTTLTQPTKPFSSITCDGVEIVAKRGMREFLKKLNRTNCAHRWTFEGVPTAALAKYFEDYGVLVDDGKLLIFNNSLVYERIFNSKDLKQGGRFYNKLENLRSICRPALRIDGATLVGFDYGAQHVRIAYALAGVTQPEADPYTLSDDPSENQSNRTLVKAVMLMIFNLRSENKESLSSAVRSSRQEKLQGSLNAIEIARQTGLQKPRLPSADGAWTDDVVREIVSAIEQYHAPIKDFFFAGKGLEFQRLDSDIAQEVARPLIARNIPIFMVHDGFYVRNQDKEALEQAMFDAFETVMGCKLPITGVKGV